jgi:UDP-glucose 4-epimerase
LTLGIEDFVYTLDLARAHIRELQRAAERSHTRNTLPSNPSRLRRLTDLVARNR